MYPAIAQAGRLCTSLGVLVAAITAIPLAAASNTVYPDTAEYAGAGSLETFKVVDRDGVWFTTPLGLRCGIADDASYGCSGALLGAPSGDNEVARFPGDPFPRLYRTDDPKFDSGRMQTILTPHTVLRYRGTSCATTDYNGVYCLNGANPDSQFLFTGHMVYRGAQAQPAS